MSESEAAGKLIKIPGIADAEPTKPLYTVGVPRLSEKGFRKLLDIVELRTANNPIIQSVRKMLLVAFFVVAVIVKPA
jgi:hypothetical protein